MSSNASTRSSSSVTVEDESATATASSSSSAPLKDCSCCFRSLPKSDFSGAQLKRKEQRQCSECVNEKLQQEAYSRAKGSKTGAAAPAVKPTNAAGSESSASTNASAVASSPTPSASGVDALGAPPCQPPSECISCGKWPAKLRVCGKCSSGYCGLACLKQHSSSQQCEAIRTMPPLSIADEDLLTEEELARSWSQLRARLFALPEQLGLPYDPLREHSHGEFDLIRRFSGGELSSLLRIYPPRACFAWWLSSPQSRSFASDLFGRTGRALLIMLNKSDEAYSRCMGNLQATRETGSNPAQLASGGWCRTPLSHHTSPAMDESRLFHRIVRYLIYYMRHIDPSLLPSGVQPHINVQSDEQGEFRGLAHASEAESSNA